MDQLRVDTDLLREAGNQLRVVANEFHNAHANSDNVSEAVGHPGLAEAVRSFAHNWDDTRAKMMKDIGTLAKEASGVGDAFDQLDQEFAASLRGERQ